MKKAIAGIFSKDNTPKQPLPYREGTLDAMIEEMLKYGSPMLHCHDDGKWICRVKMRLKLASSEFEIKSNYNHTNPQDAAMTCLMNMNAAIQELKNYAGQV